MCVCAGICAYLSLYVRMRSISNFYFHSRFDIVFVFAAVIAVPNVKKIYRLWSRIVVAAVIGPGPVKGLTQAASIFSENTFYFDSCTK